MNTHIPSHHSVRILLINPNQELLLMCADDPSTTSTDGSYHGRFWFVIGGQIEQRESPLEAAKRELFEETGIVANKVKFGPVVWEGEFDLVLSGTLTRLHQQFIVAHTQETATTLEHLTQQEQQVIQSTRWFSLEAIEDCNEVIYPVVLKDLLPDVLAGEYPGKPLWVDLGKKPG